MFKSLFPVFEKKPGMIYWDNAATTQKTANCIEAVTRYYEEGCGSYDRSPGVINDSVREMMVNLKKSLKILFRIPDTENGLILTTGTTSGINWLVHSFCRKKLRKGDCIWLMESEHNSHVRPWMGAARRYGFDIDFVPLTEKGKPDLDWMKKHCSEAVKLFGYAPVSNISGILQNSEEIGEWCRRKGIAVLLDGAQAAAHYSLDFSKIKPDFFVCSAHKMYGPTGLGLLYISEKWLDELDSPVMGGGTPEPEDSFLNQAQKASLWEPGTPHIAGIAGWLPSVRLLSDTRRMAQVRNNETEISRRIFSILESYPEVNLLFPGAEGVSIISFWVTGRHPHDMARYLSDRGIYTRPGLLCADRFFKKKGYNTGVLRISLGIYNTLEEVEVFREAFAQMMKEKILL